MTDSRTEFAFRESKKISADCADLADSVSEMVENFFTLATMVDHIEDGSHEYNRDTINDCEEMLYEIDRLRKKAQRAVDLMLGSTNAIRQRLRLMEDR